MGVKVRGDRQAHTSCHVNVYFFFVDFALSGFVLLETWATAAPGTKTGAVLVSFVVRVPILDGEICTLSRVAARSIGWLGE
jgi:hypothetical protein